MNDQCRHEWTWPGLGTVAAPGITPPGAGRSCPTVGAYACAWCAETSACCNHCGAPTGGAVLACQPCLDRYAGILGDTAAALGWWRYERASIVPAIRYDRDRRGGGRTESTFSHARDVAGVLWTWADLWAEHLDVAPAGRVDDWLTGRLVWAIQNPGVSSWHDFADELPTLRFHARRLAGLNPQKLGPCMHCNAPLVRDWADRNWNPNKDGLSDVVRCTRCGMTWGDRAGQLRATRAATRLAPDHRPDALVALSDARAIWPEVPTATWRDWQRRGQLNPTPQNDLRGLPLFRLGDLADLVERRADTARRGRKAS